VRDSGAGSMGETTLGAISLYSPGVMRFTGQRDRPVPRRMMFAPVRVGGPHLGQSAVNDSFG
jgi:hypothetical protein